MTTQGAVMSSLGPSRTCTAYLRARLPLSVPRYRPDDRKLEMWKPTQCLRMFDVGSVKIDRKVYGQSLPLIDTGLRGRCHILYVTKYQ